MAGRYPISAPPTFSLTDSGLNCQVPAAGGAVPSGTSLDVDDVAGETDQDRGEGRAPCPAGGLYASDGARLVTGA